MRYRVILDAIGRYGESVGSTDDVFEAETPDAAVKEAVAAWKVVEPDLMFNELMVNMEVEVMPTPAVTFEERDDQIVRALGYTRAREAPYDDDVEFFDPKLAEQNRIERNEACPCGKGHTREEHGYRA